MLPCQNPKTGSLVMEAGLNVTLSKSKHRASGHGAHFRIKNRINSGANKKHLVTVKFKTFWTPKILF